VTTFGKRNKPDDPALSPRWPDKSRAPATFWKREIPALYWVPVALIVGAVLVLRFVSGA
jgi:hypothetical protein